MSCHAVRASTPRTPSSRWRARDEGVPFRQIAEAIGRGLGLPATSVSPDEAARYLGFLGTFARVDNPSSSVATRALLKWEPAHAGLLADLAERHYFERA